MIDCILFQQSCVIACASMWNTALGGGMSSLPGLVDAKHLQGFRFGTNVHLDIEDEFEDWQAKVRGRTKLNFLLDFFFCVKMT